MHIAAVRGNSISGGLSPNNNKRTEVFFAGCKKAAEGNPCPGCFNSVLWDNNDFANITPSELFSCIDEENNKYVTIVGGEPMDQYEDLVTILRRLHDSEYHTVVITHYKMDYIKQYFCKILEYCNVIIDGEYDKEKRIFETDRTPGIYHVIGSSNQKIWHKNKYSKEWSVVDKNLTKEILKAYSE